MNEQDKPLALMLAETLEYDNFTGDELEAAKELRRLHAENEELRRDAERYRWLIDQQWIQAEVDWRLIPTNQESTIKQLGAAIDAAMKEK